MKKSLIILLTMVFIQSRLFAHASFVSVGVLLNQTSLIDNYQKKTGGILDMINPANIDINFDKGLTASSSYKESVDKMTFSPKAVPFAN